MIKIWLIDLMGDILGIQKTFWKKGKGKIPNYENPNQIVTGIIEFDDDKCNHCGICASICPARSIIIPPKKEGGNRGSPYLHEPHPGMTLCITCGDCLAACPNGAISLKRGFRVKYPYFFHRLTQYTKLGYPKKY